MRWATLVLFGACTACERDFSFLNDKLVRGADAADASLDRAESDRKDDASAGDVSTPVDVSLDVAIDSTDETTVDAPTLDAPLDLGTETVDAGNERPRTHPIALGGDQLCLIEDFANAVLCRGPDQGTDASASEWHAITIDVDGTKLSNARTLAAGQAFACAVAAGDVDCWGTMPGTSAYSAIAVPVLVGGAGHNFENLQAGEGHVCVSSPTYCWGDNTYSQITNLLEIDAGEIPKPLLLPDLAGKTLLTLGFRHTCVDDGDRTLCWGLDDFRQCGNKPDHLCLPTAPCATQPLEVSGISGAIGLGLGVSHSCAIKADHTVACWGLSDSGQAGPLPPGDCGSEGCVVDVTDIANLRGVTQLALGAAHSCALTADGFVYCWGSNEAAQLGVNSIGGHGPELHQVVTVDGHRLGDVIDLVATDAFTCAFTVPHTLYCWGAWQTQPVMTAATEIPIYH